MAEFALRLSTRATRSFLSLVHRYPLFVIQSKTIALRIRASKGYMGTAIRYSLETMMADENLADDLLKGVKANAEYSGLTEREIYHLAPKGKLPLFKMGGRIWCGRKSSWHRYIEKLEASHV